MRGEKKIKGLWEEGELVGFLIQVRDRFFIGILILRMVMRIQGLMKKDGDEYFFWPMGWIIGYEGFNLR